jgi:tetratricopeptide repeat protein 8
MIRDAEKQFRSALKHNEVPVDVFLWLGKVYIRLDQPLAALDVYRDGLNKYPGETFLITYAARIHEAMNEMEDSVRLYREVLNYDAINIEAIASIAMNDFYNDQLEIALRYYRRILQFDLAITCFERSLMFSDSDEVTSDVWYNIGHLALGSGDRQLAAQCFRLALVSNNDHSEAYNNLGVIEMNKTNPTTTNIQQSKAFFQASATIGKHL